MFKMSILNRENNSIVVESQYHKEQYSESRQEKTAEEMFNEIFMQKHNKLFPDGRVHTGKPAPEHGSDAYYTVSISPKFEEFETQIEPPIYPTVKALVDKGYHTISSCAGHPIRIHLQIGFGSEESRSKFLEAVLKSEIPALTYHFVSNVANVSNHSISNDGSFDSKSGTVFDVEAEQSYIDKRDADGFNFQFGTNYKKWFFLDINIMEPTSNPFKILYYKLFLLPKKQEILEQLHQLMIGETIPRYDEIYHKPKRSIFF